MYSLRQLIFKRGFFLVLLLIRLGFLLLMVQFDRISHSFPLQRREQNFGLDSQMSFEVNDAVTGQIVRRQRFLVVANLQAQQAERFGVDCGPLVLS